MRICYMVLLHNRFEQAIRLVRRLSSPQSSFVIHVDAATDDDAVQAFVDAVRDVPSPVVQARRERSRWGSWELALAALRCLQAARTAELDFDRCMLLSGQDYPIESNAQIAAFFTAHADAEFIEAFPRDIDDRSQSGWSPHYRFRRYHLWLRGHRLVLPLVRKRCPVPTVFHGSQWWALSRAAADHVLHSFEHDHALRRFFRHSFLVDEAYVHTVLMNSAFAPRVAACNLTYARWAPSSGPHPVTLDLADLPSLLASGKLFARKLCLERAPALFAALDARHRDELSGPAHALVVGAAGA